MNVDQWDFLSETFLFAIRWTFPPIRKQEQEQHKKMIEKMFHIFECYHNSDDLQVIMIM